MKVQLYAKQKEIKAGAIFHSPRYEQKADEDWVLLGEFSAVQKRNKVVVHGKRTIRLDAETLTRENEYCQWKAVVV